MKDQSHFDLRSLSYMWFGLSSMTFEHAHHFYRKTEIVAQWCHICFLMHSQGSKYSCTSCLGFPSIFCLLLILFRFAEEFGWLWVWLCSLLCVEINDSRFITLIIAYLVCDLVMHLSSLSDSNFNPCVRVFFFFFFFVTDCYSALLNYRLKAK